MTPRQIRLLKELSSNEKVYVKDLRKCIGAQNPAQVAFSLRQQGWDISTGFITMLDRDGSICHPGYYWLSDVEREKAIKFLKEVSGAEETAPLTDDTLERLDPQLSENNNSIGGEYDQPSK